MAASTLSVRVDLKLPANFRVVSCRIAEGLSDRTLAGIEIASDDDIDLEALLGQEVTVALEGRGALSRTWTLRLGRGEYIGQKDGALRYRFELFDPLWPL